MAEIEEGIRIYVSGHRGLVSWNIVRRLAHDRYTDTVTTARDEVAFEINNKSTIGSLRTSRNESLGWQVWLVEYGQTLNGLVNFCTTIC